MEVLCREQQCLELKDAIDVGEFLIIVSGPASSGKTTSVKAVVKSTEATRKAHIFCETGDLIPDVLTEIATQVTGIEQKRRSVSQFSKFVQLCRGEDQRTIVVLDSFDLLEKTAPILFSKLDGLKDSNLLPAFTFIVVTHVSPQSFITAPLAYFNVLFPAYRKNEIVKILKTTLKEQEPVNLKKVIDICAPITCDLRDIIFVAHTLADLTKPAKDLGPEIRHILDSMRSQRISRINDLAQTAAALLIAMYVASRTSILSDLMRFARTVQKRRKKPKLLEEHEIIPVERVFALAKAIIHSHLGDFETDFSLHLQLQKLVSLGLAEMRGDPFVDPRVKCLATDHEVSALAGVYDIHLQEYLAES